MNMCQLNHHRNMPANVDVVIVHTCEGLGGTHPRKSYLVSLTPVRTEVLDIKRYLLYYILQPLLPVTILITFRVNLLCLNLFNTFRNSMFKSWLLHIGPLVSSSLSK